MNSEIAPLSFASDQTKQETYFEPSRIITRPSLQVCWVTNNLALYPNVSTFHHFYVPRRYIDLRINSKKQKEILKFFKPFPDLCGGRPGRDLR